MKALVEILRVNGRIYKTLRKIDLKNLGTRKKFELYEGVDLKSYYSAIFWVKQKSRFLRKDADIYEGLYEKLKVLQDHNFKYKILIYDMPFCSKAKALMKERGWRLIDASC